MSDHLERTLRGQMIGAYTRYERAKTRFREITEAYTSDPRYDAVTAEHKASSDPRRKKAADDCQHHGAEMQRYGTTLVALLLDELLDRLADEQTTFDEHAAQAQRHTMQEAP